MWPMWLFLYVGSVVWTNYINKRKRSEPDMSLRRTFLFLFSFFFFTISEQDNLIVNAVHVPLGRERRMCFNTTNDAVKYEIIPLHPLHVSLSQLQVWINNRLRVWFFFNAKIWSYWLSYLFGHEKQVVIWKIKSIWSIPNNCETRKQGLFPKAIITTRESIPPWISHVYLISLKFSFEACRMPDIFHSCCLIPMCSSWHLWYYREKIPCSPNKAFSI